MSRTERVRVWLPAALMVFLSGCDIILGLDNPQPAPPPATTTTTTATGGAGGGGEGGGTGGSVPPCEDKMKNGQETDVDCGGGTCPPCALGEGCIVGPDCESNVCVGGTCVPADCQDSIKNGTETDIDCGGTGCPPCANGLSCIVDADCESGVCQAQICEDYHRWSTHFAADPNTDVRSIAADNDESVFLAFNLTGMVDLGGATLTEEGQGDIGQAKLDGSGDHVWSKSFGDLNNQVIEDIAVDATGALLFTGAISGSVSFGGAALTSAGGCCPASSDIVVGKLDSAGTHVWSKNFGNSQPQQGLAVATDAAQNVIVAGALLGSADFGGGVLTSVDVSDIFVIKLDANGNHIWSRRYGESKNQYATAAATDGEGNVLVAGVYDGPFSVGNGTLEHLGGDNLFLMKLDGGGNVVWDLDNGAEHSASGVNIGADTAGNVFVAGRYSGTIELGGPPMPSAGSTDLFLVKLDPLGNYLWGKRFGDEMDQEEMHLAVDAEGHVVLAGTFQGALDFGNGPLVSAGDHDVFVAELDGDGNHVWSRSFGDEKRQDVRDIAALGASDVFIAGSIDGNPSFGGDPLMSMSGHDMFLVRLLLP